MPYTASSTYYGHAPDFGPATYAPDTDTFGFRFYERGGFGHLTTIVLVGPEEQRRFLDALSPILAELRRRLAMSEAA